MQRLRFADLNLKMKTLKGIAEVTTSFRSSVVTIGNFDGIHLGHRQIIQQVVERAKNGGQFSIVYTFRPHPQQALNPNKEFGLINTYEEKQEILESCGIDFMIEEPFGREFSTISPARFFSENLIKRLSTQALYVGYDFAFGKGRSGNLDLLKSLCQDNGVELIVMKPLKIEGAICSSSRIRELLQQGDVKQAQLLLSRPFLYQGPVIRGYTRGRQIGFPTANMPMPQKIHLKPGVYATMTRVQGEIFQSVTNIGYRPTFTDPSQIGLSIETHLLDFDRDIYGEGLIVEFYERLRDEIKFGSPEALVDQIQKDIVATRQFFHQTP